MWGEAGRPLFRYVSILNQDEHCPILIQKLVGQSLLRSLSFIQLELPSVNLSERYCSDVRSQHAAWKVCEAEIRLQKCKEASLRNVFFSMSWKSGLAKWGILTSVQHQKNVAYINSSFPRVFPAAAFHNEFPYALDKHSSPCLHDYGGYGGGCFQLHSVNYGPW